MGAKLNKIFLYLILLGIIACGSTACSSTRAQNPKTVSAAEDDKSDISKTEYKAPKRVSKDVISSDKKADGKKQK